ncbi:DNA/RNA non-specific endonuclease [Variovorax sp. PAMC26660]|uniref:DNA/RNA non-specific endonuclease n=1 Tax=Variovorax sp. PAMC26660 TaxID=2762322 RepID=UPI00164DE64B|nr:DNA/RNA non-specific endonuclease [Variovorax sp. PAMC26660]QNK67755.1 DNA/RNA non-specific endonuclease [Variovorax sp. PAMC26660]
MPKKKPRKRHRSVTSGIAVTLRRTAVWLITAGAISIQATSCGFLPAPSPPAPSLERSGPTTATQFSGCREFFAGGVAPSIPQAPLQRELCYEAFAILHSGTSKTPVFVAERLARASIEDANEKRTNKFFADARLPRSERAELSDYKGSGYARGHMAPAGDMSNPTAMAQSFSLANMVPQNPTQNSGAWSKIEQDTRRYVLRAKGNVFVITGPVFGPESLIVGANRVRVPTHLFKLVYDESTGKAWAHWQPNSEDARAGRPISYGDLTQRVGMELLPGVEVR